MAILSLAWQMERRNSLNLPERERSKVWLAGLIRTSTTRKALSKNVWLLNIKSFQINKKSIPRRMPTFKNVCFGFKLNIWFKKNSERARKHLHKKRLTKQEQFWLWGFQNKTFCWGGTRLVTARPYVLR